MADVFLSSQLLEHHAVWLAELFVLRNNFGAPIH